jgi:DNA-binding NarL/FixJ family response regulator
MLAPPKRILVADDHPLYRDAVSAQVRRLYPHAAVDETSSLDEALVLAGKPDAVFDLFLFDIHMPGMSEAAVRSLVANFPSTPVAVMSGTANAEIIRAHIRAGARGFVPKTATGEHLARAIQLLLAGGTSVPVEILDAPEGQGAQGLNGAAPWLSQLTPRELEVLKGTARGLSNKEIGREMNLAEVTVKLHLRSIFRKIGARSRADAAVIATKAGIG